MTEFDKFKSDTVDRPLNDERIEKKYTTTHLEEKLPNPGTADTSPPPDDNKNS
ncbi:hypothetical protein HNR59_002871 [Aquamicrobium lusatiense]|uniref:Uncharacterized protein n=1 Tax=Aquamicrobium lusatiense TaxID=89772 RepID=A0A7W9S3M6_9HYPH|nr:hypothetical protein [Aquamicrobium lusatiense]MBB6013482.1 hypothetical protein [Aquamicrobium lusatiense]